MTATEVSPAPSRLTHLERLEGRNALEAIVGAVEDYGLPVSGVQDVLSDIKALRKE